MEDFVEQLENEKYQRINSGLKVFVAKKRPEIEKEIDKLEEGL